MGTVEDRFKVLLSAIRVSLKPHGFRRRGESFALDLPECWSIVNLQKSWYSSAEEKRFTINLGVASKHLLRFDEKRIDMPPREPECHWRERLGHLMPERRDKWWDMAADDSPERLSAEVTELIRTLAIPQLTTFSSDTGLPKLCCRGWTTGPREYVFLQHRALRLAEGGHLTSLEPLIEQIRAVCETPVASRNAEIFISLLRQRYPLQYTA